MQSSGPTVHVSICDQKLELRDGAECLCSYPVSTSGYGIGSEPGSLRTPTGAFRIAEKIGDGAPSGMVFRSRRPTGEIGISAPDEDLVLTRILWLEGLEPGNANTRERYIYIHGTNHEDCIGQPCSHGCIRMRNADVIDLFDRTAVGTHVFIQP